MHSGVFLRHDWNHHSFRVKEELPFDTFETYEEWTMRISNKTVDASDIMSRILSTMEKRGIRQKDLMMYIGVTEPVFTQWKYNRSKSYMRYLDQIAQYLHVSREYLLSGNEETQMATYSIDDIELMHIIHELPDREKQLLRQIADTLYEKNNIITSLMNGEDVTLETSS